MATFTTHREQDQEPVQVEWPEWADNDQRIVDTAWDALHYVRDGREGSAMQMLIVFAEIAMNGMIDDIRQSRARGEALSSIVAETIRVRSQIRQCTAGTEEGGEIFRCGLHPLHSTAHAGLLNGRLHVWSQ